MIYEGLYHEFANGYKLTGTVRLRLEAMIRRGRVVVFRFRSTEPARTEGSSAAQQTVGWELGAMVSSGAGAAGLSDQALMELIVHRRPEGLEQLYDRYSGLVYSLICRITAHPSAADELLQDVFLRLWNQAPTYRDSRGAVAPWLLTMARNIAIDHLRSKAEKQRKQEFSADIMPVRCSRPDPEGRLDRRRQTQRVQVVMGDLPEKQRKALELAYFQGLTQSEISTELQVPLGTVKTWIRTGLRRIRQDLEVVS